MAKVAVLHKAAKSRPADEAPVTEAVDLSLRLLERLAASREPMGVSELAREFAASKATIYRHLQTLAARLRTSGAVDDALRGGDQAVRSRRAPKGPLRHCCRFPRRNAAASRPNRADGEPICPDRRSGCLAGGPARASDREFRGTAGCRD